MVINISNTKDRGVCASVIELDIETADLTMGGAVMQREVVVQNGVSSQITFCQGATKFIHRIIVYIL